MNTSTRSTASKYSNMPEPSKNGNILIMQGPRKTICHIAKLFLPKELLIIFFFSRLFFFRGGGLYLHPSFSVPERSYFLLYRVTLESSKLLLIVRSDVLVIQNLAYITGAVDCPIQGLKIQNLTLRIWLVK